MGKVGLTFAPGKAQPGAASGAWERDLQVDLDRLGKEVGAHRLICLLQDDELAELGIDTLPHAAEAAGLRFHRLPITDGGLPDAPQDVAGLVSEIAGWAAAGENVVIHCKGGLGRAGTIGGCVLRAAGMDAAGALDDLARARGPACPETCEQRLFIERFVPSLPAIRSRILGAVLGAAIGDALGHPTEFLSTDEIRRRHGPAGVTGFFKAGRPDGMLASDQRGT